YIPVPPKNPKRCLPPAAGRPGPPCPLPVVPGGAARYLHGVSCWPPAMRNVCTMSPPSQPEDCQYVLSLGFTTISMYTSKSGMISNGRQIGQRVAQKCAVHWVSHGGSATRTKRRPEPPAQPVASVR